DLDQVGNLNRALDLGEIQPFAFADRMIAILHAVLPHTFSVGPIPKDALWVSRFRPKTPVNSSLGPTPLFALLDFDLGTGVFNLFLDRGGLVLVDPLFDRFWRAIDQILGFLQPETGDFADRLDHVDLVRAHLGQHHREFRLLLGGGCAAGPSSG